MAASPEVTSSPAASPFLPSGFSFSPGTDTTPAQRRAPTVTPSSASSGGGGANGFFINVQRESPVDGPFLFAPGKKAADKAHSPSPTHRESPLTPSWGASEAQPGGGAQGTQASPFSAQSSPLSFSFSAGPSPSSAPETASPTSGRGAVFGGGTPFPAPQPLFGQPAAVPGVDPSAFVSPFTQQQEQRYGGAWAGGRRDPRGGVARKRGASRPGQSEADAVAEAVSRLHVSDDTGAQNAAPGPTVPDIVSKLRDEGTALYRRGQFDKAEAKYTEALAYVGPAAAEVQTRTALLCNRAAARLTKANLTSSKEAASGTLGALQDCLAALELEPVMGRAQEWAGACLLRVGRYAAALAVVDDAEASSRVMAGVTAGASKLRAALNALAAAGVELWRGAAQHLPTEAGDGGSDAATAADPAALLALVDEAMGHAPYCLAASRARVEALLLLRRPKCAREALEAAAFSATVSDRVDELLATTPYGAPENESGAVDWWLPWTNARLDLAAGDVDTAEAALVSLGPAPAAARQALAALRAASGARAAGNELFKARRWSEAADAYSQGLAAWARQPGGITISAAGHQLATLLCNRAAALHAKGMRLEATADAGAALALSQNHAKALSRRAALYMEMRMPKEALEDLNALKATAGGQGEYSAGNLAVRIREAETAVRGKLPPEMYSMLGLDKPPDRPFMPGGEQRAVLQEKHSAEIKKAFRRAALRLHPDKAVTAVPAGAFAGVEAALRADAERLFRLASDAANKLGDQDEREAYCAEERRRTATSASGAHGASFRGGFDPFGRPATGRGAYGAGFSPRSGFHWNTGVYHDFDDEEEYEEEPEFEEPDAEELARQQEAEAAATLRRAQVAYEAARRAREQAQRAASGYRRHY